MKTLTLLLASLLATATLGASLDKAKITQRDAENALGKRDCWLTCPLSRTWCHWQPYSYSCNDDGSMRYKTRELSCEDPQGGCWCSCDALAAAKEDKTTMVAVSDVTV
ncbi:hypothetical protein Cob_v008983 [Colletotrichum orbiculare MAFF 240422]|uniref:Uncharacterized protein n=1 Tax=Colletotrichum orbiculare (strain 104-T / ATCC 96160 / CBS 514.97 / LARS 414 / MAFF 240422) TaxID=1213857 RepID=N4VNU2_COLOR|nr:hypothetical protein Cob_v008983 [Colletotrichum orbiculare MAFF 240422]